LVTLCEIGNEGIVMNIGQKSIWRRGFVAFFKITVPAFAKEAEKDLETGLSRHSTLSLRCRYRFKI
jgi:hypothetical protein